MQKCGGIYANSVYSGRSIGPTVALFKSNYYRFDDFTLFCSEHSIIAVLVSLMSHLCATTAFLSRCRLFPQVRPEPQRGEGEDCSQKRDCLLVLSGEGSHPRTT